MKLDKPFVKFLLVGLLNTAFGSGVYAGLIYAGLPIWAALIAGNAAGIAFNFFTTGRLVFSDAAFHRFPRFVTAYLICYVINYAFIRALLKMHMGAIESQLLMAAPMALLSFYMMSRYVFDSSLKRRSP